MTLIWWLFYEIDKRKTKEDKIIQKMEFHKKWKILKNLILNNLNNFFILWSLKQNSAHLVSGKYIPEEELDMSLKTADLSCSFPKEPEISVFGKKS